MRHPDDHHGGRAWDEPATLGCWNAWGCLLILCLLAVLVVLLST